jgi:hypothetical protein
VTEFDRLTDIEVKIAKPRQKAYALSDGGGLYLWVTPSGGKLWRWSYVHDKREKLMSFGPYPLVTIKEAREAHKAARKLLNEGTDPMQERKAAREASKVPVGMTFDGLYKEWFEHWSADRSGRYSTTVGFRFEKDVLPNLGSKPIQEIKTADLIKLIKRIQSRDVVDIAKRDLQKLKQVFRYAIAHEYLAPQPRSSPEKF